MAAPSYSVLDVSAEAPPAAPPRGRLAPSPSWFVHLGNAATALVAWASVRRRSGTLVWRLEDLDGPRTVAGMAEAAEQDLAWLGIDWDEGGGRGGARGPYEQSARFDRYADALARLAEAGRLFPCTASRKDLASVARAPHGPASAAYPAVLRPRTLAHDWFEQTASAGAAAAVRFRVDPVEVRWTDRLRGARRERVDETVGDFVLRRRDGVYAYQLAVVVDDIDMGIDEVVRGVDLVDSTGRQLLLWDALGARAPQFAHAPLLRAADGAKLSKRDRALTVRSLREAGASAAQVVGALAHGLGLNPRAAPMSAGEFLGEYDEAALGREDWTLPADAASWICSLA